jgi:hypothetical protein
LSLSWRSLRGILLLCFELRTVEREPDVSENHIISIFRIEKLLRKK